MDILSAPSLGFCYQTHLQDADWSDSGEVLELLQFSSSHSSSMQFSLQGIRKKINGVKAITSVKTEGKPCSVFFFSWDVQMLWQAALLQKLQKCNGINRIT